MLGSILGAVVGPLTEGMASAAQYQASKHERNVAWRRAQAWELMAPSLRVAGLRAAGLNPILAATSGFHGGQVPHVPQGQPGQLPRFGSDVLSRAVASAKQAKVMSAQVREAEARAKEAESSARYADDRNRWMVSEMESRSFLNSQQGYRALKERDLVSAQVLSAIAGARRSNADAMLLEAEAPAAQALSELYLKYPWLRQVGGAAEQVQKAIPRIPLRVETGGKTINLPSRGRR